ncbi:hypothetical protein Bhyg_09392, partial [Pseudolycoriella hygida]
YDGFEDVKDVVEPTTEASKVESLDSDTDSQELQQEDSSSSPNSDLMEGRPLFLLWAKKTTTTTTFAPFPSTTPSPPPGRRLYKWLFDENYEFTTNRFQPDLPQWKNLVEEFQGKPVELLEIGSLEGRSSFWLLENICTHPDCKLTTIDSFEETTYWSNGLKEIALKKDEIESRFRAIIAKTGKTEQVEIIRGKSFDTLIGWNDMKINSSLDRAFDFVYIDGSHLASDVLLDAMLVWPLLKPNGIIIFDDYILQRYTQPYNNPSVGIDAFVAAHEWEMDILERNYQLTVRKVQRERPFTFVVPADEKPEELAKREPIQ